jgi:hypothetical protein
MAGNFLTSLVIINVWIRTLLNRVSEWVSQSVSQSVLHKIQPLVPLLSQMTPVHIFSPYFRKIHSNITFPSTLMSSRGLFPSGLQTKILHALLISPMRATCPAYHILTDLITLLISGGRTSYEAPHHVVFSSLPPLPPSQVYIYSTLYCSHTPSDDTPSLRATNSVQRTFWMLWLS